LATTLIFERLTFIPLALQLRDLRVQFGCRYIDLFRA